MAFLVFLARIRANPSQVLTLSHNTGYIWHVFTDACRFCGCTGTISPKGIVQFKSCNKAVANAFHH